MRVISAVERWGRPLISVLYFRGMTSRCFLALPSFFESFSPFRSFDSAVLDDVVSVVEVLDVSEVEVLVASSSTVEVSRIASPSSDKTSWSFLPNPKIPLTLSTTPPFSPVPSTSQSTTSFTTSTSPLLMPSRVLSLTLISPSVQPNLSLSLATDSVRFWVVTVMISFSAEPGDTFSDDGTCW